MSVLYFVAGFAAGIAFAAAWRTKSSGPSELKIKLAQKILDERERQKVILIETIKTVENAAPEMIQGVECLDEHVLFELDGKISDEVKTAIRKLGEAFVEHSEF